MRETDRQIGGKGIAQSDDDKEERGKKKCGGQKGNARGMEIYGNGDDG